MEIEYTTGCICDSLTIAGKDFNDMTIEEMRQVAMKLLNKNTDDGVFQRLFIDFMESNSFVECEFRGQCEECGDCIYHYSYKYD